MTWAKFSFKFILSLHSRFHHGPSIYIYICTYCVLWCDKNNCGTGAKATINGLMLFQKQAHLWRLWNRYVEHMNFSWTPKCPSPPGQVAVHQRLMLQQVPQVSDCVMLQRFNSVQRRSCTYILNILTYTYITYIEYILYLLFAFWIVHCLCWFIRHLDLSWSDWKPFWPSLPGIGRAHGGIIRPGSGKPRVIFCINPQTSRTKSFVNLPNIFQHVPFTACWLHRVLRCPLWGPEGPTC